MAPKAKTSITSWAIPAGLAIYLLYYLMSDDGNQDPPPSPEQSQHETLTSDIKEAEETAIIRNLQTSENGSVAPTVIQPQPNDEEKQIAKPKIPEMGSASPPSDMPEILKIGDTEIQLIWVKPGSFKMGSQENEQNRRHWETQHEVTITEGFWLGKFELTQEDWTGYGMSNPSHFKATRKPVEKVTWEEAVEFCRKLSNKVDTSFERPEGYIFRLPTEAEWEYSCRASTITAAHFGDKMSSKQANFDGRSPLGNAPKGIHQKRTMNVGSYEPNSWGFHDMHGNVWEWCLDHWNILPEKPQFNPLAQSPNSNSIYRVVKGGSWYVKGWECRSTSRHALKPSTRYNSGIGLRIALARELPL